MFRRSHVTHWAVLAVVAFGPVASLAHVLHERHTICAEHPGSAHHDNEAHSGAELAALRAMPERFPEPGKPRVHEHCGVVGAFERACEKAPAVEPIKPALAPHDEPLPSKPRALPAVIYAYAPKTSPPASV